MILPGAGGRLRRAAGIKVFACFALAYFMSFALRSIGAVIAPELTRDFGLTNSELGALSSAYFLAFAAIQLPLGVWLDRYGARRTHGLLLLLAAVGCAVFALAAQAGTLWIGRALSGMGVAGALMSALKGYRFWFPVHRQQQLAAFMLMAGSCGALATTVPARLAMPAVGWRGLFWIAAALFVLASLLILWLLPRDEERSAAGGQIDGAPLWGGYAEVFRSAYFWRFALVSMLSHAGFVSLQTLWAGPWLMQVDGLSAEAAAQVLLVFNVALMGGFMVVGALAPTIARRGWPMTTFTATGTALLLTAELAIALWPGGAGAWVLWPLLALVSTFFSMVQPHVSLSFPPALTGRAYTAYNLLLFVAMFGWQWLFGVGVDLWTAAGRAGADGFRATMFSAIGVQVTGLAVFLSWRAKPAPSPH
ncbi:MAG TPA: MFS transporter [Burkholderiaceae bacterium]|nr:MFS transporter [Burkholderiaceae bacterium]